MSYLKLFSVLFVILLLQVFPVTSSAAKGNNENNGNRSNVSVKQNNELKQEKQENKQNKLNEGRIRSCQAKEKSITNRLWNLMQLSENMELKFNLIAGRVKDYYTEKLIPEGKAISNYNELLTQIDNKRANIQIALTDAQQNASKFNCTTGDPKVQLAQYRQDMQEVNGALKEYRTSIRNLIVAVHSNNTDNKEKDK